MRQRCLSLAFILATFIVGLASVGPSAAQPVKAVDIMGREVSLAAPARRIVLAQGRQLPALNLLLIDPVSVLVGIGGEFQRQDAETFALYRAKFPALAGVTVVGNGSPDTFSLEKTISLKPDLVILSRNLAGQPGQGGEGQIIRQLTSAGIPVAVIDFYAHPIAELEPSLRILGQLLGREKQADAYIAFYREHLARITARLPQDSTSAETILLHAHAGGTECCFSPGTGSFNDYILAAGGKSIASGKLAGLSGHLDLEYVLAQKPSVYVGTGGTYQARRGGLVLGTGVTSDDARQSLLKVLQQPGLSQLSAVRSGRAFGLWQSFNESPMHIVAIELLAKWLHPDQMKDIDPAATLAEINTRFLAVPMTGTYWTEARQQ